jgi:hypothetical protein
MKLDYNKLQLDEEDKLEEKLHDISKKIEEELYKLRYIVKIIDNTLDVNYDSNNKEINFDNQELIEEQFDNLLFEYAMVKELFKKGREIRYYKENNIINKM